MLCKIRLLHSLTALASIAIACEITQGYDYVDFTVPGAADTILNNINDSGRVVGVYGENLNPAQPFTEGWQGFVADMDGGNLLTLEPDPSAVAVEAAAINNQGTIVGSFLDGQDISHGFVFDGTDYHVLDVPFDGAVDTVVSNISESGVVTGFWAENIFIGLEGQFTFGFRATPSGNGTYVFESIDLGAGDPLLTFSNTFLSGRNISSLEIATLRRQTIVLDLSDPDFGKTREEILGLLLEDPNGHEPDAAVSVLREIRYPDATFTRLTDLSDEGVIVGTATQAFEIVPEVFEFSNVGFLVRVEDLLSLPTNDVPYFELDVPGSGNRYSQDALGIELEGHLAANSIDSRGTVVGFYDNDDGVYRGFIGIPSDDRPGDFNGDGQVNQDDLFEWNSDFGLNADSDADTDGDSDGGDFLIWQRNFEYVLATTTTFSVPEPASRALAASAIVIVFSLLHFVRDR